VIIVDSVVNEGRSVRKVLDCMQGLLRQKPSESIRFYVMTAVMQANAAGRLPKDYPRARFVTLRVSENKYQGKVEPTLATVSLAPVSDTSPHTDHSQ
jgi:hypothetical protein